MWLRKLELPPLSSRRFTGCCLSPQKLLSLEGSGTGFLGSMSRPCLPECYVAVLSHPRKTDEEFGATSSSERRARVFR
jgi:hypothetical protein